MRCLTTTARPRRARATRRRRAAGARERRCAFRCCCCCCCCSVVVVAVFVAGAGTGRGAVRSCSLFQVERVNSLRSSIVHVRTAVWWAIRSIVRSTYAYKIKVYLLIYSGPPGTIPVSLSFFNILKNRNVGEGCSASHYLPLCLPSVHMYFFCFFFV